MITPMSVTDGFQIEKPNVFVPWTLRETEVMELFDGHLLRRVTHGYYTIPCTSLSGLTHMLGLHFHPGTDGVLAEFEFFQSDYDDMQSSYEAFQGHLEKTFGPPTLIDPAYDGFPYYRWALDGAQVVHYVLERFGPEEHVHLRKV